jgi:hypothetical protein
MNGQNGQIVAPNVQFADGSRPPVRRCIASAARLILRGGGVSTKWREWLQWLSIRAFLLGLRFIAIGIQFALHPRP